MKWTKEQSDAIYKKGSNILVAAAAGSGKTAVLVERIIQKILNDGVDIDKLLVVTFTNAAASEMRERVLEAIYKKLDEEPENENLQKQIILLGKSNICTIHSFCLDVIKNNFFEIDLSANFRIASEEEIELLKQEVIEDVFERLYEEQDEEFEKLVNTYTEYRGDEALKEIALNIYKFMQSSPFPNEWLEEKVNMFERKEGQADFSESIWGEILLKNLKEELLDAINGLKLVREKLERYPELEKWALTIATDIDGLKGLYDSANESWDKAYLYKENLKFKSWPIDRKLEHLAKDEAQDSRKMIKDKIMKHVGNILTYDSDAAFNDVYAMKEILEKLKNVIFEFDKNFKDKKRERNIIDFNDIEHYALKILVKKDEDGNCIPTDVAKKYQEKFEEIAIDEYQDSNQVQEYILNVVSRNNNIFMVGDVKQSIYKFRQACPELFLGKYENYSLENANEKGLKIQLFKNFRSRKNVLDVTNVVFENIMSKTLGDIDYNENEYLNLGASYEEVENGVGTAELDIIDLNDDEPISAWIGDEEEQDDYVVEEIKALEKEEIEASHVAQRIEELINKKYQVFDKKLGFREITYKDIVILLRSTSKSAPIFEKELLKRNIPVFSDSSNEYLDTIEIQTITNLLKVLDNPIDDIPLVAVLRSEIGKFTDNEIVEIRLAKRDVSFYESLLVAKDNLEEPLKGKVNKFLEDLNKWQNESDYLSLAELIWNIYVDTGFYNYVGLMPNGSLRQANLKMLFERAKEYEKTSFKGLFNFIRFVEKLKSGSSDMSAAKIIGENENVVRIMSIHKSKGLEFPVVFLSCTSKRVNLQDLNSNLLFHQKYGIGPQYINYEKRVEYSTAAKDALKIISRDETISEEMRVLYVALTRAKEKLIITGTCKDYEKDNAKKNEFLRIYNTSSGKINPLLLKKYITYLDWILLVIKSNELKDDLIKVRILKTKDIVSKEDEKEVTIKEFDFSKEIENIEELEKEFNWEYPNMIATNLPIKSTVSKIKEMKPEVDNNSIDFERMSNKEIGIEALKPNFMDEEDTKITGARRGTLMHLFLQKINLKEEYDIAKLENLREKLIAKGIILDEEKNSINLNKIMTFINSDFAKKLRECEKIEKEKAFCIKIKASEIFEEANDEDILVQGIIDVYGITKNGDIILADYKTDFVENEIELVNKYQKQLEIYKDALEKGLLKKVNEVYIYSLCLNKDIKLSL